MSIVVNLPSTVVSVQPGASAALPFTVRNVSSVVDSFTFEILGPVASWSRVEPLELAMLPGEQKDATLVFAPPRDSQVRAGVYIFGLRIISRNEPAATTVEEATVQVAPYTDLVAVVTPQTAQAGSSARVRVRLENNGNAAAQVTLSASDPDELIDFRFDRASLDVPAGSAAEAGIVLSHRRRTLRGAQSRHRYSVTALGADGSQVTANGDLVQRPQLAAWIPKSAAAVIGLVVLGGGALALANRGDAQKVSTGQGSTTLSTEGPSTSAGDGVTNPVSSTVSGGGQGGGTTAPTTERTTSTTAKPTTSGATNTTAKKPPTSPDLACKAGFVFREAGLFDRVCVKAATAEQVKKDNSTAAASRAGAGPFGPDTCKAGFVWREAFPLDRTCVAAAQRTQAKLDNDQAPANLVEPNKVFTCKTGLVARNAVPGDFVCVTVATQSQVRTDNADALKNWDSANNAFGPDTCKAGFVWREAYPADHVCVSGVQRDRAAADNQAAVGNFAVFPGVYACSGGLVARLILASDVVCVPASVKTQVVKDNLNAAVNFLNPPGAQGFVSCKAGLERRGAFAGDAVCVTKADHDQAVSDSTEATKRWVG